MSEEIINEAQYWAGFFDGEGSILITKDTDRRVGHKSLVFTFMVTLASTNKQIIEELKKFASGGYINKRVFKRPNQRDAYYFNIKNNKAVNFLKLILPYLKLKKRQAELGIEFQEKKQIHFPLTKEDLEYRVSMQLKIRELNHLDSNKGRKMEMIS